MTDSASPPLASAAPPERPPQLGNVKATRDDWLALALSVLAVEGVAHVTVLTLSERLGVSRSSFYWYFKNRDELLDALLDRWDRLNTRSIVAQAEAPAATVNEAVCNVFRCWVNPAIFSPRLDFAVREWARRSASVRKALDRSDRVRTEALEGPVRPLRLWGRGRLGAGAGALLHADRLLRARPQGADRGAAQAHAPLSQGVHRRSPPSEAEVERVPRLCGAPRACPGFRLFASAAMSARYSAFALLQQGLAGHKGWPQAWRKAKPKPAYDFVIVGGGGHGLATAYYLAKTHKRPRVCVIEKGWLGGGNTGRNTTIVRSNYFYPESVALYDLALRLYEGLSRELNFNVMLSQRGILNISHTPAQLEIAARLANAMQLNGVDAELWGPNEIRKRLPLMTQSLDSRYLPNGGVWQRRGGTARHDAVAWGYARAADRLGVDIVENCEATGFIMRERRLRRRRDDARAKFAPRRSASRSPAIRRS